MVDCRHHGVSTAYHRGGVMVLVNSTIRVVTTPTHHSTEMQPQTATTTACSTLIRPPPRRPPLRSAIRAIVATLATQGMA